MTPRTWPTNTDRLRGTNRPLTVLIAPDSFKGSLTSVEVARALADGWSRARPDDTILLCPLADGGEGTLEAVAAAGGWAWQEATVARPARRARSAPAGCDPTDGDAGRHRDGRGIRPVAGRRRASATPWRPRRPAPATLIRARSTRGRGRSCSASAGARRPTAAPGCCARWAPRPTATHRARPTSPASTHGSARRRPRGRLRRLEPAARRRRGGRDLWTPEGRDAGRRRPSSTGGLAAFADALEAAGRRAVRETPGAGAAGGVGYALLAIARPVRGRSRCGPAWTS